MLAGERRCAPLVELHGANFTDPFTTGGAALQGTEPLRVCRYGPPMWDRNHGALSALLLDTTRPSECGDSRASSARWMLARLRLEPAP